MVYFLKKLTLFLTALLFLVACQSSTDLEVMNTNTYSNQIFTFEYPEKFEIRGIFPTKTTDIGVFSVQNSEGNNPSVMTDDDFASNTKAFLFITDLQGREWQVAIRGKIESKDELEAIAKSVRFTKEHKLLALEDKKKRNLSVSEHVDSLSKFKYERKSQKNAQISRALFKGEVFDGCGQLESYETEDFYQDLLATFSSVEGFGELHFPSDACYAQDLDLFVMLTNTPYELGGSSFYIWEYDTHTKELNISNSQTGLPYPTEFAARDNEMLKLLNTICAEGEGDFLTQCAEQKSDYYYNLLTRELIRYQDVPVI
jgi:hypothetical protein